MVTTYLWNCKYSIYISLIPFFGLDHLCGSIIVWNVQPKPWTRVGTSGQKVLTHKVYSNKLCTS